jgi:hypothetical protein
MAALPTWHWRPIISPASLWICWVSLSRRAVRAPRLLSGMSKKPIFLCPERITGTRRSPHAPPNKTQARTYLRINASKHSRRSHLDSFSATLARPLDSRIGKRQGKASRGRRDASHQYAAMYNVMLSTAIRRKSAANDENRAVPASGCNTISSCSQKEGRLYLPKNWHRGGSRPCLSLSDASNGEIDQEAE